MSAAIEKFTVKLDVESIDIPTMDSLSPQEYREYLKNEGLFLVDHHDILRSSGASYPLATSKEQLEILISELSKLKHKLR